MNKLRVGGETIDPKKQYSGSRVIELLGISYNNGYNSGKREHNDLIQAAYIDRYKVGYKAGYKAGCEETSADLTQLKELLARLLEQY